MSWPRNKRSPATAYQEVGASPPLQTAPDRALIRVELLRLAHRHDKQPEQIVEHAKVLEAYVFSEPAADKF